MSAVDDAMAGLVASNAQLRRTAEVLDARDAAVATEREACAQLLESIANDSKALGVNGQLLEGLIRVFAAAIRARGGQ